MKKYISLVFIVASLTAQQSQAQDNNQWSMTKDPVTGNFIVNNVSFFSKNGSVDLDQVTRLGWIAGLCANEMSDSPIRNATAVTAISTWGIGNVANASSERLLKSLCINIPTFFILVRV